MLPGKTAGHQAATVQWNGEWPNLALRSLILASQGLGTHLCRWDTQSRRQEVFGAGLSSRRQLKVGESSMARTQIGGPSYLRSGYQLTQRVQGAEAGGLARAQASVQLLALGAREGTHEDGGFISHCKSSSVRLH